MNTYDYYKDQTSRKIYFNQYIDVSKNESGETEVTVESSNGTPLICKKGVWQTKSIMGATQYIPEGDPRFVKGDLVWGKQV